MAVTIPAKRGPKTIPEVRVLNPGKGLNTLVSDSLIQDTEASDLNNIQYIESGCVSKSYGISAVGSGLTNNPKGLGTFYITGGSKHILTVDGTSLKYLNSGTWTALSGASFTSGKEVNFVQANDALYIWDGDQAGCSLNTSLTLTRLTTAPRASFGIWYSGYQLCTGVDTLPNRLYISDTATNAGDFTNASGTLSDSAGVPGATAFAGTGAQFVDINPGDGDKITALAKFQNALVIFKERSIYQLTFSSTGTPSVSQITSNTGAVSHKSVDNVENDIFYLSRNGYYVLGNEPNYYNVIRSNELSARIKPIIETLSTTALSRVCSMFSDFKYWSSIATGSSTTATETLVYDRRYLAWSTLDYVKANSYSEYIDTSGVKHLYYAADDTNKVYEIVVGSYSADGTAIDSWWTSKAFDAKQFDIYKRWFDITLFFRQISGSVTITIYADNNDIVKTATIGSTSDATGSMGTAILGSQILGGTGATASGEATRNIPYRIKINTKSRTLKIKVSNGNDNENFVLLGFNITYVPYSHYSFPSSLKIY